MYKSLFSSLMIILALMGTTAFTLQISSLSAQSQSSGFPDPGSGDIQTSGPNPGTCFTARFRAASDCDRLASLLALQAAAGLTAHRPSRQNCFSKAFSAASDCDRLASMDAAQLPVGINVHGPTVQSCFSGAYPASSDCDRLASMQGSPLMVRNGLTAENCFSEAYHAGSDCDRVASGIQ